MKNIMFGIAAAVAVTLAVIISLTFYGRASRQTELDGYLSVALEQTMKENSDGKFHNNQEMIDGFVQNLIIRMDSDSDLTINVLGVDTQRGMLSVEVLESFEHPNKKRGQVSCRKTIILDRLEPEEPPAKYQIRYYRNRDNAIDSFYAEYVIQKGDALPVPPDPVQSKKGGTKKHFTGWSDEDGNRVRPESMVAEKSCTLYACFE